MLQCAVMAVSALAALIIPGQPLADTPGSHVAKAGTAASSSAQPAHLLPPVPLPPLINNLTPPDQDPFYRPPSTLDGYRPGGIVRSRSADALLDPRTRIVPSKVWQIMYRSTTATGGADAVTGTVIVPALPWTGGGPRPLVSYAVGTHGFADRCAPSYELAQGTDIELPLIYQAVARGWAVAVTDYEGLGTPGDHTYAVQLSEGQAVLDAARAAMNLHDAGISSSAPVGLWGYSEGGGAAGMAAELADRYAPELHAVGVAEGGTLADVLSLLNHAAGIPVANGALPIILTGYARAYPSIHLYDLYTAHGLRSAEQGRHECLEFLATHATSPPAVAFTRNPLTYPPLVDEIHKNDLGHRLPDMPIFMYHAVTDELVPYQQARDLYDRYCGEGARAKFVAVPGEHAETGIALAPVAIGWLADRFADRTPPSTC